MIYDSVEPLPIMPTLFPPGTPEKLRVMEQRAARKEQLFHPADARFIGDARTLRYLTALRSGSGLKAGKGLIQSKYFGPTKTRKSKFFS